jgi:hypothetical protein
MHRLTSWREDIELDAQLESVGVDLSTSGNKTDLLACLTRHLDGLTRAGCDVHPLMGPVRVAGADDVTTPRKLADLFKGTTPKDQCVTHRHSLKTTEILTNVPEHILPRPDDAVISNGGDSDDLHQSSCGLVET